MSTMLFSQSNRLRLLAGSAIGLFLALDAAAADAQTAGATPVSGVEVGAQSSPDYKVEDLSLVKLTQPVLDTPTIVAAVPRQVMDDRGATSLADVFRNVSGIAMGAGESSWQGTNLTLRGFNARNDIYLDGMRDFGSYYRDPFDLEQVEVLQGPSSMLFGRGSTGGAVNQVSKTPSLDQHISAEGMLGTDHTRRATADINVPLPELGQGAAFRMNVMGHESEVAGRENDGKYRRYGFAPSLALGLGTPTRIIFSYLHQSENDIPDYGIPWLLGAPAPVPRDSFYGFSSDYLNTDADVATIKIEHDFSDALSVHSQFRAADYHRDWRDTEPQPVTTGVTAATPLTAIAVTRALQGGKSRETLLQNQTDVTAKVTTGFIRHTIVAGFEFGPESSTRSTTTARASRPPACNPATGQQFAGTVYPRIAVHTNAFSAAGYIADTMKFGEQWELTGGIRYDSFRSDYQAQNYAVPPAATGVPTTHVTDKRTDDAPSYRAGLVYKPMKIGSIYFDYSTSFNPSAEALSEIVAVRSLNTGNLNLAPEKNRVYELGTKWELMDNKILLQGAIFREEKYNARVPDPLHSGFNILGGDQRVDGAEAEIAGHITDAWQVTGSYTYLDSKVIKTAPGGPAVGMPLFNAPKGSFNLWTTYQLPYKIEIGGGVNHVSSRLGQNTPPIETAPGYTTVDAMAKYQLSQRIRVQLNVYNIGDTYYYDQLHGFHIIPGPGRSALLTLALSM